ncbi:MAG: valine--tRNA ligase [Chloroflexota bacterium]|nr:valine--tRNA ligase [Chloroflexota bacterium]
MNDQQALGREAANAPTNETVGNGMDKAYRPAEIEPRVYARWLEADVFAPDGVGSRADQAKAPFVIIQPPPNVTGALHLGHAARGTVEDLMVRRARMQCRPTLWLPGVDHASIAAQFVLDGVIAAEGETRQSLGRERYLERMWRFMEETRGVIRGQQRRLGLSADWSRERFTMDEASAQAVRTSFKQLHDDGLTYRAEKLTNWCPSCLTSLSDLEVIATPETGTLWSVRYHLLLEERDGDSTGDKATAHDRPPETITVATTRPETILGDTAVAVHPEDERHRGLIGRRVRIPFVDRIVPIVADEMVDRAFGTGAVKITPAHDQADFEVARRHDLPIVDVMEDDGSINSLGGPFAGLSSADARRAVLAGLESAGDLAAATPHEMVIGRCQRSDDIVEPRIKVQWFIAVKPMAERAMAAIREGRTRIVPKRYEKVFFAWLENIRDWNVSRQLWWGHRIPAWYCPDDHVTVSDKADGPDACGTCQRPATELRQEEDIFDTWYSSGLWPFSTLGWPEATEDLRRYYPGTVMETAYDILFFWVARMMMLGEWLMAREPFETVLLSGLVRDPYGKKMSKTKDNSIDPLGVIDELGADALRFALVHGSGVGADQRLGRSQLEGARNFGNKLWNAARFVLGARPDGMSDGPLDLPVKGHLGPAEHWILVRCAQTVEAVEEAYRTFAFGEAARLLHDAVWNEYCDWYLELAKVRLAAEDADRQAATWAVLTWVLDRYLRLLHPIMPHLTEEIWGRLPSLPGDPDLLIVAGWPDAERERRRADEAQARGVEGLIELVSGMRNVRAEAGIEPGTWLPATLHISDADTLAAYGALEAAVGRLARVRPSLVAHRADLDDTEGALTVLVRHGEARLARGDSDPSRERQRLTRELEDAERLFAQTQARLTDDRFVERAPPDVVQSARERLTELGERVERLRARSTS